MIRWVVVMIVVLHGLIHLLGAAKGFGWAAVSQLREPIVPALGAAWLTACVLMIATGVLLACRVRWWWIVGAVAVLASQAVILTSWNDAKVGSVANVLLLGAVVYGCVSFVTTAAPGTPSPERRLPNATPADQ